eukprot:4930664-Pyramimonas_sp.AAC.1
MMWGVQAVLPPQVRFDGLKLRNFDPIDCKESRANGVPSHDGGNLSAPFVQFVSCPLQDPCATPSVANTESV